MRPAAGAPDVRLVAALIAALIAACEEPAAPRAGVVEVHLTCDTGNSDAPCAFSPAEVSIRVGEPVRWVNDDATYHTVTSSDRLDLRVPNGRFDAILDAAGEAFTYTFSAAGAYPYYCQPHAEFMAGTVRVLAG